MNYEIFNTKEDVISHINNNFQGYDGYVQFSHRAIDKNKDIFNKKEIKIENEEKGFIYEAHFFNGVDNVTIRQQNNNWIIGVNKEVDLSGAKEYLTDIKGFDHRVRMAQTWEEDKDEYCANMYVKKLKKVIFAGFVPGGQS